MGFSITGLIIAILIFAPNLLMLLFPAKNVPAELKDAGKLYTVLERIGQIGCILLLCLAGDYFGHFAVNVWLVLMVICIALYYGLWLRYVIKGQDFLLLFCPLLFVPVPMAVFPVLAFAFAAVAGQFLWLGIAVVLLAIGHFANSLHTYKQSIEKQH
jgi:hypothetical protein